MSYKINQIAKLFDLHPDTLRYYEEQGLVSPQRQENGYRSYTVQDICSLGIVRELRRLDMPVNRIAGYMQRRDVAATIGLLDEEHRLIAQHIAELTAMRKGVERRRAELATAGVVLEDAPGIVQLPPRKCYRLETPRLQEPEVDVELRRLQASNPELARLVGARRMGAVVDMEAVARGRYDSFKAVLFLDEQFADSDSLLAGGMYARSYYRGEYDGLARALRKLIGYAKQMGFAPDGDAVELYHIDVHDTLDVAEYLTEVQLPIAPLADN